MRPVNFMHIIGKFRDLINVAAIQWFIENIF